MLTLWIVVAFGFVGGFWNHAFKVVVVALHDGAVPAELVGLFMSPEIGSVAFESLGILTFAASLIAADDGYRFARVVSDT